MPLLFSKKNYKTRSKGVTTDFAAAASPLSPTHMTVERGKEQTEQYLLNLEKKSLALSLGVPYYEDRTALRHIECSTHSKGNF